MSGSGGGPVSNNVAVAPHPHSFGHAMKEGGTPTSPVGPGLLSSNPGSINSPRSSTRSTSTTTLASSSTVGAGATSASKRMSLDRSMSPHHAPYPPPNSRHRDSPNGVPVPPSTSTSTSSTGAGPSRTPPMASGPGSNASTIASPSSSGSPNGPTPMVGTTNTIPVVPTPVQVYAHPPQGPMHAQHGYGQPQPPPDRKSTRLNSSHSGEYRMPSSA